MNLKEDDDAAHYEEQIADKKQQAAKDSESIKIGGTEADSETSENPVVAKKTGKSKIILVVLLIVALGGWR